MHFILLNLRWHIRIFDVSLHRLHLDSRSQNGVDYHYVCDGFSAIDWWHYLHFPVEKHAEFDGRGLSWAEKTDYRYNYVFLLFRKFGAHNDLIGRLDFADMARKYIA